MQNIKKEQVNDLGKYISTVAIPTPDFAKHLKEVNLPSMQSLAIEFLKLHDDQVNSIREDNIRTSIENKLGSEYVDLSEKIKNGEHSNDEVLKYHNKVKDVLLKEYVNDANKPIYSDLASDAIELIISDFESCLYLGNTFIEAVDNLNCIGKNGKFKGDDLVDILRNALYGRGGFDFPDFAATLWTMKTLRPKSYYQSLNVAKWSALIGFGINAYNEINQINVKPDAKNLFLYSLLMRCSMFDKDMPLAESGRKFSDKEKEKLKECGQKSYEFLQKIGFPHNIFMDAIKNHQKPNHIYSAIQLTAKEFEGMFFNRQYKDKLMPPKEVFDKLGEKLFKKSELSQVQQQTRYRYAYDGEEAEVNPLLLPYQMMRLLFGILDH
ncbi:hypothetical protein KY312_03705 [Candidatus Woesearchaeota archaeon]|nr:hypothetical protein [Candidatus Woesearchaeota archaeon]